MSENPRTQHARRGWKRPHASMLFLILGILLLLGAAYQAYSASRSYRNMVASVMESHARVAAWTFEQYALPIFRDGIETLFHPLHAADFASGGVAPYELAVLTDERPELEVCARELRDAVRFGARFAFRASEVSATGDFEEPEIAALRDSVRAHYSRATPDDRLTGHEQVLAARLDRHAAVVIYSLKPVRADTLVYALVMDPAALEPFFDRVLEQRALLPEPLLQGTPADQILALHIVLPDGERVYGFGDAGVYVGGRPMRKLGGLVAQANLTRAAEQHLILGAAPQTRLPWLLGLLGLAIGLLVVAFSQLRREHALSQLRSDFVSSISHELRTPLALQRVFLEMLTLGRVHTEEKKRWCLDNIGRESARLAHLVEKVLHFSRAEQGTMKVAPERTELAPLVAEILTSFEPLAAAARVRLVAELEHGIEAPVDADALRQVLMNLLENAVKYGPEGQAVRVTLSHTASTAVLTVDDDGPGIAPQEREAIFEPFRRGEGTTGTAVAGSGIGLSVVRELVRRHGGRVYATDGASNGACFIVELPDARLHRRIAAVQSAGEWDRSPTESIDEYALAEPSTRDAHQRG